MEVMFLSVMLVLLLSCYTQLSKKESERRMKSEILVSLVYLPLLCATFILKENLSLCSCNYFCLSICKLVGSAFFFCHYWRGKKRVQNAASHGGC